MEGEAAAAVLQVLVQNLIDHSKKEISLIRHLHKHAAKLTSNLDTIQKFLNDAETPPHTSNHGSEAVKIWLKKLENFAFDADNVLDELNYHLLSAKINSLKPIKEKVLAFFLCSSFNHHIARPRKMGFRIREINDFLDSINKEATDLGLVARLAADEASTLVDASFETASFTVDPILIGRDDDVSKLVEMLTPSSAAADEPRAFSILCIVGMGGLGKTTLTRKVFNDLKDETNQFVSYIWVHVSQIFDPIALLKKILKGLICYDIVEVESKQEILKKLQEALKDKTYLLVLDDVWNQDIPKWEDFINSLLGVTSTKGNAIVVTTRSLEVASLVSPLCKHELDGLSEEDCWLIIKAKVFGKEVVPSELETIGRKIARRCQGLPLAANIVGGVLSNNVVGGGVMGNNKYVEKWVLIEEKWLSLDEGENIKKILRLSLDNLSRPSLKKCFAYCSIFPKGHRIRKTELIEYWMAEGFLEANERSDMESVGEEFFNVLLHNSLLQGLWKDRYGDVAICGMHDLVHDLASSVLCSSCGDADRSSHVRYRIVKDESSPISKEEAKHLRTLLLDADISGTKPLFSGLEHLHVLRIRSYGVMELPSWVRKLIHLRNLDISETDIYHLPDWIGELHLLLTLRVDTRSLKKLPSTIKYLINLRHLYIDDDAELPAEIGKLTHLQTLKGFKVGDGKGYRIEELGSLDSLKGEELKISNLERVTDKEEAEKANLFKKSKVSGLRLVWDVYREVETSNNNDENVLEGLQPHSHLKKLVISGFRGKRFSSWTLKMAVRHVPQGSWVGLNNLTEIRLIDCLECEEIPMLGHLPYLKSLELRGLRNVKCISSSFYGLVKKDTSVVIFPALERLELCDLSELVEWAAVEFGDEEVKPLFPRLQHLEIIRCERLTSLPTHFSSSPCFQHLKIICSGLLCLPDRLFYNNPNLANLVIKKCPKLREFPEGLECLNHLEELTVRDCPSLERIAADHSGEEQPQVSLKSLRHLSIHYCSALAYFPCGMVGSSLVNLLLEELRSLKNLPCLISCLHKSPYLNVLKIVGVPVPDFMPTHVENLPTFHNLQFITIVASMGSSGSGSVEAVDGILQGCRHSLTRLELVGWKLGNVCPNQSNNSMLFVV